MSKQAKIILGIIVVIACGASLIVIGQEAKKENLLGFTNLTVASGVTGSGTTNQIAYWDSGTTIAGSSALTINTGTATVTVTNLSVTNATNISSTSTGFLAWQTATGTLTNLFNLNVSGTIDTASGTGMTCGGLNCRQALMISAQSGTPPAARPAATSTATYMATNGQVAWLAAFQPLVQSQLQWSTPMPNNYDGGTLNCHINWVSTSTATFTSVGWGLRAVAVADGGTIDAAWGATSTWGVLNNTAANVFNSTSDTTLTVGGTPTGGKEIWFEASRLAGNAATTTQNLKSIECTYGVNKYNAF